jgi:hypothetical protein
MGRLGAGSKEMKITTNFLGKKKFINFKTRTGSQKVV